ncbi:MAG TPA: hypothetical protein VHM26_19075 [Chitinophagaceae bacterium]|jgi:hypothetical protein|nr:hypothetical protein [Chitinophagaceae bacterium]
MPGRFVGHTGIAVLSHEEAADPAQVLLEFFEFAHLHQVKMMLEDIKNSVLTKRFSHLHYTREEDDLNYFFEKLEKLIEASYLLKAKD